MRKITLIGLALVLFASTAKAQSKWPASEAITAFASTMAIIVDCETTHAALHQSPLFVEANPLLGKRPSSGRLNTFCGAAVLTNLVAVPILFHHKGRLIAWTLTFGIEATVARQNALTIGMKL